MKDLKKFSLLEETETTTSDGTGNISANSQAKITSVVYGDPSVTAFKERLKERVNKLYEQSNLGKGPPVSRMLCMYEETILKLIDETN